MKVHLYTYLNKSTIPLTRIRRDERAGQAMSRDMTSYYANMTEYDLRKLRSKKIMRGLKISKSSSWFDLKEKATLRQQIRWIDAELLCRHDQLALPI